MNIYLLLKGVETVAIANNEIIQGIILALVAIEEKYNGTTCVSNTTALCIVTITYNLSRI